MVHRTGDTIFDRMEHFSSKERATKLGDNEKEEIVIRVTETLAREKLEEIPTFGNKRGGYRGIQDEINDIDSLISNLKSSSSSPVNEGVTGFIDVDNSDSIDDDLEDLSESDLVDEYDRIGASMNPKEVHVAFMLYQGKSFREAIMKMYGCRTTNSISQKKSSLSSNPSFKRMRKVIEMLGGGGFTLPIIPNTEIGKSMRPKKYDKEKYKALIKDSVNKGVTEIPVDVNRGTAQSLEKLPDAESKVLAKLGENFRYRGFQESEFTVSETFIINNLKILAAEARADKKFKDSKDCIELLARIIGLVGEKVRKETSVITRNVSEVSSDLMLATKALGIELPPGVISLLDARKNGNQ